MLKSIEKITGLGVYQSYIKPAGTQDFGIKNLIYGWNYSGKTTLSRLFAQLKDSGFILVKRDGIYLHRKFLA